MKTLLLFSLALAGSCGWNAAGVTGCHPVGQTRGLPDILQESSAAAFSRSRPGLLFSHNDGGHEATIYVLDRTGSLEGEIPLSGTKNRDWEDMATGECLGGNCIYIADIGDNQEIRDRVYLYRISDTGIYDGSAQLPEVFPMILPDGPRDMEAVQNLTDDRQPIPRQFTGADASVDGKTVALRTYEALTFYSWDSGQLEPMEGERIALRTLNETQGEAVALGPGVQVVLTSEAALGKGATLTVLECRERIDQR